MPTREPHDDMEQHLNIAVLEDDLRRTQQMVQLLREFFPEYKVTSFDNAPDMISWLGDNLNGVKLICLDHDLGANRILSGVIDDPGTGRDVADYLATQKPVCPVLIHSSNVMAAPGMMMVLEDAGWPCSRLSPFNDLEWVRAAWIGDVKEALRKK